MKDSKLKRSLLAIWDKICYTKDIWYIRKHYSLPIMTAEETITHIKKNKCSVSRYGDGEISLMLQYGAPGFQKKSKPLAEALLKVFENTEENLLICMPIYINSTRGLRKEGKLFWGNWTREHQQQTVETIQSLIGRAYVFGDAGMSRPYSPYKTDKVAKKLFPMLKSLWEDRDILIVEGMQTRLGVGNDLFANAKSIKRILGPAENAYDRYSEILQAVISHYSGELVVLALGPTATILAADLSKRKIQALDLGHIDIQYEWYLSGGDSFRPVFGKYTNEATGGQTVDDCYDETYLSQIIATII